MIEHNDPSPHPRPLPRHTSPPRPWIYADIKRREHALQEGLARTHSRHACPCTCFCFYTLHITFPLHQCWLAEVLCLIVCSPLNTRSLVPTSARTHRRHAYLRTCFCFYTLHITFPLHQCWLAEVLCLIIVCSPLYTRSQVPTSEPPLMQTNGVYNRNGNKEYGNENMYGYTSI